MNTSPVDKIAKQDYAAALDLPNAEYVLEDLKKQFPEASEEFFSKPPGNWINFENRPKDKSILEMLASLRASASKTSGTQKDLLLAIANLIEMKEREEFASNCSDLNRAMGSMVLLDAEKQDFLKKEPWC